MGVRHLDQGNPRRRAPVVRGTRRVAEPGGRPRNHRPDRRSVLCCRSLDVGGLRRGHGLGQGLEPSTHLLAFGDRRGSRDLGRADQPSMDAHRRDVPCAPKVGLPLAGHPRRAVPAGPVAKAAAAVDASASACRRQTAAAASSSVGRTSAPPPRRSAGPRRPSGRCRSGRGPCRGRRDRACRRTGDRAANG